MPVTTLGVPPVPPALPMATTWSPVATFDESAALMVVRPEAPSSWMTATSSVASVPTTWAV